MRLRDALYRGGIAHETLEVLIHGNQDVGGHNDYGFYGDPNSAGIGHSTTNQFLDPSTRINPSNSRAPVTPVHSRHTSKSPSSKLLADRKGSSQHPGNSGYDEVYFPDGTEIDERVSSHVPRSEQPSMPRMDQRTIILRNLADRTTHRDIVNFVRGGMLLDVYFRYADKSANVSFVHGAAAQEFMAYMKRNEVYLHGRIVAFAWSDRQYTMPNYIANKIGIGATRNLVIRRLYPKITENRIREDLDHIHNLVIIDLFFANGDAYLSLSSVRSSLFARTCMMSRVTYKGLQIEWYPDECALPLPQTPTPMKKEKVPPSDSNGKLMVNRFQLLNMDEGATEDGSSFGEENEPTITSGISPLRASRRGPLNGPAPAA